MPGALVGGEQQVIELGAQTRAGVALAESGDEQFREDAEPGVGLLGAPDEDVECPVGGMP